MSSTATTFYFNEIFDSYETWQELMQSCDFIDFENPVDANFDKFCFTLLNRHYNHCNIRYFEIDAFISELLNVYQNKFKQFQKEKEIIDNMENLTLDDLIIVNTTLTNMANNPNDMPEDPLKPLQYISAQTYNEVKSNKVQAYLQALNNIPSLNVYKFFKSQEPGEMGFDDLFMQVVPVNHYLIKKGV